jgi:VanZ family protein
VGTSTAMWRRQQFISYWVPPILWSLAVLSMSGDWGSGTNTLTLLQWVLSRFVALDPDQLGLINHYLRKTGHCLSYGGLYFLWFRAFYGHGARGPGRSLLWSLGCCLCLALLDEGRQWLYPSRGASMADVILDMSGSSLGALLTAVLWTPGVKTPALPAMTGRQTRGPE